MNGMDGMEWSDGPRVAVARLADPAFVRVRLEDVAGCITRARTALGVLEAEARDAWTRYPVAVSGGFHAGAPDPRPALLAWTVRHLHACGFYDLDELERRHAHGEDAAWAGAEALRLLVALDALGPLLEALRTGSIRPERYTEAVARVTGTLVRAHIVRAG